MTSGLFLVKPCDQVGCIRKADVGLRLCVPHEGQIAASPGHMQKVLGIYLCMIHYHELKPAPLFRRVLTRAMEDLFTKYAAKASKRPPNFREAWFEALPMNASELWKHEKAKATAVKV
jgi:hypothetical protein